MALQCQVFQGKKSHHSILVAASCRVPAAIGQGGYCQCIDGKMCFLLLICVILQGEGFMNYPLFLGLPCLRIINDKKRTLIYNKR